MKGINEMNEEYPYEEELKLSADREMFDACCISCAAEDAFYEAEAERIVSENKTIS